MGSFEASPPIRLRKKVDRAGNNASPVSPADLSAEMTLLNQNY